MAKRGGQSTASPETMAKIVDRMSNGEALEAICRDDDMPSSRTVSNWKMADDAFASDIARARELGFDAIAWRLRETSRGKGESTGDVQRDKLIIETDLKLLSKWDKRYSDKLTVESKSEVVHRYDLDRLGLEKLEQLDQLLADAERSAIIDGAAEPAALH